MMLTEEMIAEDEKRWNDRNIVVELGYCGKNIRHRKNITNDDIRFHAYIMRKAHALLKEQETIVRCKDCKNRPTYPAAYGAEINGKWCYWCELHRAWKPDDWYCADGERKEGCKVGMKTNKYQIAEYDDLEMPSDDMDTDIRNWHSHLVKVRKDTKCVYCGAPIRKGDFALSERGFCDGEPFLIHDCIDCTDDLIAFQKAEIDSEEYYGRWEKRHKKYAERERR